MLITFPAFSDNHFYQGFFGVYILLVCSFLIVKNIHVLVLFVTMTFLCEQCHEKTCFLYMSLVVRKPVFGVSDQVPHKPGGTATEDG